MSRPVNLPWAICWATRHGPRRVVAMASLGRDGLVSIRWVVDARTGRAIDLGQVATAERLALYEAIRDAEAGA